MEISCFTHTGPGTKNCFCYMVYLQGMPHQFEINVINAFYNKFWNQFGKFLKRSWFFAFGIWKKRRLYVFNLLFLQWLIFIAFSIYCFFDDHGTWLLLLEYFWWFVQVSAIFERLFSCYFVVPISLTRKFREKNTHTTLFFFEKSWAKFFLKPFVFAIQF